MSFPAEPPLRRGDEGSPGGRRLVRDEQRRGQRAAADRTVPARERARPRGGAGGRRQAAQGLPGHRLGADGARARRVASPSRRGGRPPRSTAHSPASNGCRASSPATMRWPPPGIYAGETLRSVRRDRRGARTLPARHDGVSAVRSGPRVRVCRPATASCSRTRPRRRCTEFQRARQLFPNTPAAVDGTEPQYHRLPPLRARSGAAGLWLQGKAIGPEKSELRDATGISFDQTGQLMLGHRRTASRSSSLTARSRKPSRRSTRPRFSWTSRTASSSHAAARSSPPAPMPLPFPARDRTVSCAPSTKSRRPSRTRAANASSRIRSSAT